MSRKRITFFACAIAVPLALVAAGCGGGGGSSSATTSGGAATTSSSSVSGSITFDGVWTGAEAQHFQAVIDAFNQKYPNVKVKYKPVGDNLPTVVSTAVAGGNPPDMADIAQPGLIQQFVDKGALQPIEYARSAMAANFAPAWLKLGTYNGKLYSIVFKASNKSTIWYNVHAFTNAGVTAPSSFTDMGKAAQTIAQSGVPPFSIGGADGWTLTDLFENIYLRQAGADKYAQLSAHKIKWTDPSVITALKSMQALFQSGMMAGGTSGAIQTDFPTSVNNVFQNPPKAAMVLEGDFVPGVATVKAKAVTDYNEFPFPPIGGSGPAVEIGGDSIVAFRDTPAIEAFVKFLATSDAAAAWAKFGGFATGNKNMSSSVYPDAITKKTASAIAQATSVVFDMSDQQPASFGATTGQGEWGIFQDFLRNPSDVNGIAQKLESAATAAYKKGS
ncbi:MAG TPA: extracellular solute-binding protein [Gaiellaceae bacterium]|nr:extracellular solute-binding protein [Gaiellaceae bacterium]